MASAPKYEVPEYVDETESKPKEPKAQENPSRNLDSMKGSPAPSSSDEEELDSEKKSSKKKPDVIRYHSLFEEPEEGSAEIITIYCRTRKTLKKAAGGATATAATAGVAALALGTTVVTGGFATPWIAAGTIGVGGSSYVVGGAVTGYLVNSRVMRFDFENYNEANEAFRQISTYKIMIRNGVVAQSMGKMRWVAELVGAAITDESEKGPGLLMDCVPEPYKRFNILRSPMTYGASKSRWRPWQKFNIKQYSTDYQETAEEKWKKISSMNSAVLFCGSGIEKTYGKKAYVNELIGWFILEQSLPAESKNHIKVADLDDF